MLKNKYVLANVLQIMRADGERCFNGKSYICLYLALIRIIIYSRSRTAVIQLSINVVVNPFVKFTAYEMLLRYAPCIPIF